MNEDTPKLADGVKLIYLHQDGGRVTDTGVYLAPGIENVVEVGQDLSGELAHAFVERGICAVYGAAETSCGAADVNTAPKDKNKDKNEDKNEAEVSKPSESLEAEHSETLESEALENEQQNNEQPQN